MIDARGRELLPEVFADTRELLAWCDDVWGSQLGSRLPHPRRRGARNAIGRLDDAGRALGITQLLMTFAARAARGQSIVPAAMLASHGASAADVTAGVPHKGRERRACRLARDGENPSRRRTGCKLAHLPQRLRPALVLLSLVGRGSTGSNGMRKSLMRAGDVSRWRRIWAMWG